MVRATSFVLAGAIVACGSDPAAVEGAGGSASSGATTSTTTGGGPAPLSLHASFVAETAPGQGPSLLRLANDTVDEKLSITLPDGEPFAFYAVDWLTTTDYEPVAITTPVEELVVSVHTTENLCIRILFEEISGVQVLEPLHAYTLHVTLPDTGFAAEIVEEELPEPFLGVRARVDDPSALKIAAMSTLELTIDGEVTTFEKLFFPEQPVRYTLLPAAPLSIDALRYVAGDGSIHEIAAPIALDEAPGYTVVVATKPVEGAAASVELVRQD
jgi:hypothetical protein